MNKYHFVFKDDVNDYMSRGEVFEGEDPMKAYTKYAIKYPHTTFLAMYSTDIKLLPLPDGRRD